MDHKPFRPAASYALLVPQLCAVVAPLGYALAVHGSLCRDLDLIAVPWVPDAAEPEKVIAAITEAMGGIRLHEKTEPTRKPHGRLVYTMHFRNAGESLPQDHPYIDLSIVPRSNTPPVG